MANFNRVMLMGNLTRDVEMKYTPSGQAVAQLGLAINRKYKDLKTNEMREEVTFVDVEVWGKTAELAHQYLAKGRNVFIEGRLKLDQWDDKTTGQKRSKLKVVCDRMQFLGAPPAGGARPASGPPAQRPAAAGAPAAPAARAVQEAEAPPPPEDLDIQEENIPF